MSYELSVNRVMALCASANRNPADFTSTRGVVADFRRQMNVMGDRLDAMYQQVIDVAEQLSCKDAKVVKGTPMSGTLDQVIDVFVMPADSENVPKNLSREAAEHIVGLFPTKVISVDIAGMEWLVRMRPSVTACVLQRPDGRSKLWWSFEGIPADPLRDHRPSETEAASFLGITNAMAQAGLDSLQQGYRDGFAAVTGVEDASLELLPQRIRINLSDNDGTPFAALVDAMNLDKTSFEQAKTSEDPEVNEGAGEVSRFVEDVTGAPAPEGAVSLNSQLPQTKAVICEAQVTKAGVTETLLTGVARSGGMRAGYVPSPSYREIEYGARNLRSISAARPLSATLAMQRAITLDLETPPLN